MAEWGQGRVAAGLRALAALALPTACAACGAPDHALCPACRDTLSTEVAARAPRVVAPDPCPAGMPRTVAAAAYLPPVSPLVPAFKDDGRRDLAPVLAGLLAAAVDAALAGSPVLSHVLARGDGPVLLVPVPTSPSARRRRGDAPMAVLARTAADGFGHHEVACSDALRLRRRVADQAGLSARDRRVNLEHAMEVEPGWAGVVAGAGCVLVDDVLTTGATLVEARRALLAGGATEVVAATVCATQRRPRGAAGAGGRGAGTSPRDRDLRPLS